MKKVLTISTLGHNGRFGNQLFQLATGLGLARKLGVDIEIPADWIGRKIFKINLPAIKQNPSVRAPLDFLPTEKEFSSFDRIDLYGYFQYQNAVDLYSRKDIREWFQFQDWVLKKFHKSDKTIVEHIRRGDYVSQPHLYCSISDESYKKLEEINGWDSNLIQKITEENPVRDKFCESIGIGFLPDFMLMVNSDILVRSNSTFSFWGGVFSHAEVWAPLVEDKVGWQNVEFVKGNWPRFADSKHHPVQLTDLHLREE
jgi:hypothetical protein